VDEDLGYEIEAVHRTQTRWSDGTPVHRLVFRLQPGAQLFDRVVLKLNADQVGRFWLDRRIRGFSDAAEQVPTRR